MKWIKYFGQQNSCLNLKLWVVATILSCISCDEEKLLKEVPLDFYSPENSYVTVKDFEAAVYNLHAVFRNAYWYDNRPRLLWEGTDLVESFNDVLGVHNHEFRLGPAGFPGEYWTRAYKLIYDANVIIARSENDFSNLTSEEKAVFQAEAKFFRAHSYAFLAHTFGGVPIVLEETVAPKRDYVRASRQEVYEQCIEDLKFAVDNLPDIDEIDDSRINKLAASHVLAEVYIQLGQWQNAIDEASKVINHPRTALMTSRFGSSKEKMFNDPDWEGDLFWDLFRQGNQDRSIGNTESIWVLQYAKDNNTPGGGTRDDYILSRNVCPDLTSANIRQSNGKTAPVLAKANSYYSNRGQGFTKPSPYFLNELWKKSGEGDIRCSKWNIVRDYQVLNPNNEYNGKWVIADNLPLVKLLVTDTSRFFYPTLTKCVTPGMDPQDLLDPDQSIPGSLRSNARRTYRKHYQIRLAETYLLRAEAYLGSGNLALAADDINVVRRRANAPEITGADVDIDYILDERMRELAYEELRMVTLARVGKLVDRNRRLNPVVGNDFKDHMNLWAIPLEEIQKNVEATLVQNTGY